MRHLEQVVDTGCSIIRKSEVLRWFSQERMTINIWRDLQAKWEETLEILEEDRTIPLLVGESEGLWTLAWGEGLETSEKAWFKDVRSYLVEAIKRRKVP
jgi:hypothetical protein